MTPNFLALEEAQLAIRGLIDRREGGLVSRLGSVEYDTLKLWSKRRRFPSTEWLPTGIARPLEKFFWNSTVLDRLETRAGFYPVDSSTVDEFCHIYLDSSREIDLFGSWLENDHLLAKLGKHAELTRLAFLEPFFSANPWTESLVGKRVLVITPFEDSVRRQMSRRAEIFKDSRLLPDFELLTVRAPQTKQSIDRSAVFPWPTWFDALQETKAKIAALDFDLAIIGAGAYGLPLGAFVKRMNRVAIHLGGPTQLLFGIRGSRWEKNDEYRALIRPSWTYPSDAETPVFYREQGGYWGPKDGANLSEDP